MAKYLDIGISFDDRNSTSSCVIEGESNDLPTLRCNFG